MKKLVFGALVSALSVSAFALVHSNPSMHSAHQDIRVGIQSRGTDVKFMACDGANAGLVGPGHDGTGVELRLGYYPSYDGKTPNYVAVFNSLHYGESFTFCTKFKLTGGYEALRNAGYQVKLQTGLALVSGSDQSYITDSGLRLSSVVTCKNPSNYGISTGWNKNTTIIDDPVAPSMFFDKNITGTTGYPESCEVRFTFTETSVDQRLNTDGEAINLDLDLDVSID